MICSDVGAILIRTNDLDAARDGHFQVLMPHGAGVSISGLYSGIIKGVEFNYSIIGGLSKLTDQDTSARQARPGQRKMAY